jgi:hypothetical protein
MKVEVCPKCKCEIGAQGFKKHVAACKGDPAKVLRRRLQKRQKGSTRGHRSNSVNGHDINFCPRCGFPVSVLLAMMVSK